jgi:hypothetical protein
LVLLKSIQGWTLTTPREKLIGIGAKVVRHSKYLLFQLAEVAVPRQPFARILEGIADLRPACGVRLRKSAPTPRSKGCRFGGRAGSRAAQPWTS